MCKSIVNLTFGKIKCSIAITLNSTIMSRVSNQKLVQDLENTVRELKNIHASRKVILEKINNSYEKTEAK